MNGSAMIIFLLVVSAVVEMGTCADPTEVVSQRVSDELTERASQFGLFLDDISLTHLSFGKEFTEAVELKQVAQQEAERARYLVEKAEHIRKATVISAEGDAIAADLLAKAFQTAFFLLVVLMAVIGIHACANIYECCLETCEQLYICPWNESFCEDYFDASERCKATC